MASRTSCASAEEALLSELEHALAANDARTARKLSSDPICKGIPREWLEDSLFACCEQGQLESVALLLELGVSCGCQLREDGSSPIHLAAKHCHADVVERLLHQRADPEARMRHQITPLLLACERADGVGTVQLLLAHKASADAQRDSGGTPLVAAASSGHAEIVWLCARRALELPTLLPLIHGPVPTQRVEGLAL